MNYVYLGKRLVIAIVSMFIVATLVFVITNLLSGSAARLILGQQATEQAVEQLREQMGLNRPLHAQYIDFVLGVFTLDFGKSLVSGSPIIDILVPKLRHTLELAVFATLLSIVTAIPLSVVAAAKRNSVVDNFISTTSYIGTSMPTFVTASLLLLYLTGPPLGLPNGGYAPLSEGIVPWIKHMILPAISLNIIAFAYVMRQTRSSLIETLESDYIRTARLKGVPELKVLFKHALRNGLLPAVTVLAFNFGWMMGSVVIVEEIFTYPGIGQMIVKAIETRDLPLIQAGILVPTAAFIIANLIADILYTRLDPRITLGDQ